MKSRRNLIIIALVVLVSVVGLSYAFFNYYQVSERNLQLITGEIYLRLDDGTDEVMLLNAFPETREEARARDDNYITFTITGKNTTTNHDIHYEIDLNEGDPVEGRTRLKASDLRFDLVEIRDGEEVYVVWDESFENFDEKRIWVDHVFQNTTEEIERVYKLRMWISDDVLISDTDANASYTTGEYKNSYASVKVSVFGDFNEKATDASCFMTESIAEDMIVYNYQEIEPTGDQEAIETCKTYFTSYFGSDISDAQDGYKSFCEGTGTIDGVDIRYAFNFIDGDVLKYCVDNNIVTYEKEERYYNLNKEESAVEVCNNYLLSELGGNYYNSICTNDQSFNLTIREKLLTNEHIDYLESNDVLIRTEPVILGVRVIGYDSSCGSEIIVPTRINGYKVLELGDNNGTFASKNLTKLVIPYGVENVLGFGINELKNVVLPSSVRVVGMFAFVHNLLEYIHIPDSVTYIGDQAFNDNQLSEDLAFIYSLGDSSKLVGYGGAATDIVIPDGVKTIGEDAFGSSKVTSVVIPSSVTRIEGSAFNYTKIKEIVIPDSVTYIGDGAFSACLYLKDVTIGSGITYIGKGAFDESKLNSLAINKSCVEIKALPASSYSSTIYYPWLSDTSPYTATGVTIYGANGEVCDTY